MDHGAACSQICTSEAETVARDPVRSVCLIEVNFRSPAEPGLFRATDDRGLTDALTRMGPIRSFIRPVGLRSLRGCDRPGPSLPMGSYSSFRRVSLAGTRQQWRWPPYAPPTSLF
jgi:hypothetical protein